MEKIPMIFEDKRRIRAIIFNEDEGSSIWAGYGDTDKMIGYAENGEVAENKELKKAEMSKSVKCLMMFDPAYGTPKPYPSEPDQYRYWHGKIAWLYNPYTGKPRHPADIGSDVTGILITPPTALKENENGTN